MTISSSTTSLKEIPGIEKPTAWINTMDQNKPPFRVRPIVSENNHMDFAFASAQMALARSGVDTSEMDTGSIAHRFGFESIEEYEQACAVMELPDGRIVRYPPGKVLRYLHWITQAIFITEEEYELLGSQRVAFFGASVGGGITIDCACTGIGTGHDGSLMIFDPSTYRPYLNRQALFPPQDINKNKALVVGMNVLYRNPYTNVLAVPDRFDASYEDLLFVENKPDFAVEEIDSVEDKILIHTLAKKYGIDIFMFTDLGDGVIISQIFRYSDPKVNLFGKRFKYDWEEMLAQEGEAKVLAFIIGFRNATPKVLAMLKAINQGNLSSWSQEASTVTALAGLATKTIVNYVTGNDIREKFILSLNRISTRPSFKAFLKRSITCAGYRGMETALGINMLRYRTNKRTVNNFI